MLHRKASPVNIYAGYQRTGKKMNHEVGALFTLYQPSLIDPFSFYWDTPDEAESSYPHSFKQLEVNYALRVPVLEKEKIRVEVGGRQRNRLIASEYLYAMSSSFSYYFSFGLDASGKVSYFLNDANSFSGELNLSLFALNSRSPYLGYDSQYIVDNYSHNGFKAFLNYIGHAKPQSWGNAQDADLKLTYERKLSDRWSLNGSYYGAVNFNQSPTTYASVLNTIFIGTKITL